MTGDFVPPLLLSPGHKKTRCVSLKGTRIHGHAQSHALGGENPSLGGCDFGVEKSGSKNKAQLPGSNRGETSRKFENRLQMLVENHPLNHLDFYNQFPPVSRLLDLRVFFVTLHQVLQILARPMEERHRLPLVFLTAVTWRSVRTNGSQLAVFFGSKASEIIFG